MQQTSGMFESIPIRITALQNLPLVDTLQIRGMDRQRFIHKLGKISSTTLEEIVLSIAAVIEYV